MASSSPPPGSGDGSDSSDGSDEDVYVVKRILAEGGTDEERVFLIEWEGYDREEATWEPEDNVLSKETLKAWKEEKLRQREGLSQPLDTDEFERIQEEYARTKRRRERLGLPKQSKPSQSNSKGDSSSDEAEEAYVEVPDYEGIPQPKKSRQTRVKHDDPAFHDDDTVMNDASGEPVAPPAERRRTPKPAREPSTSEDRHRNDARPTKIESGTKANVHRAPVEAPSATGYQGTAHRGPAPHSTVASGGRSVRGRPGTAGRGSHMAMSKLKPKAPRTIEHRILTETSSKEAKAPLLFSTKSQERKFELGAKALADRPPAKIPKLINPAAYANLSRIRKKGSVPVPGGAVSQTPGSASGGPQPVLSSTAAVAPMVSSPEELLPQEDATTAEVGKDHAGQETEKLHRPPNARSVSFAVEESDRDQAEQSHPSPVATFRPPTAPVGSTSDTPVHGHPASSGAQDPANSVPSAPVRRVSLANYSAKQNGVKPTPASMFNQAQDGLSETTLKTFIGDRQAQDDPIMLKFIDVSVHHMAWGDALQQLQSKGPVFNHICRSTDVDNSKSEFNPTLLARGRVTTATGDDIKGQESVSALADYLRINISGLLYNFESLNIIIYPTRCEEWKFIEYGIQLQHSGQLSFFSFTTPSKIVCHSYNREAESRMSKMKIDGYDYHLLNKAMFGFSYQGLHQVDKKSNRDFFFLLFPNMTAPVAEHMGAWLRSSNKECKIYTCQQAGSWRQFVRCTANPEGGSLIIHNMMIPLIPRYPKLQEFLLNGLNNVWCIDEDFPQGKYLLRLFPHGGAVCLTSGFLSGEPEMALFFLNWFLPKRESRASTGTWKLLVCRDVYKFLSNQAFGAAKRRAELLESLPSSLTDSQKDTLATASGLSMKNCQDRFDLMDVMGKLVRPKNETERDLDSVLQADNTRSLMVFADEDIKPSDDCGLIRYFAYWSMLHLKTFRKFIAIGSNSSPEEHEDVVVQVPEISNTSSTKPVSGNTPQDRPQSKSPGKSKWKRGAFSSVDGANDDDDFESTRTGEQQNGNGHKATGSSPVEPDIECPPGTTQTLEADDFHADVFPEEADPDGITADMDSELLKFVEETGASPSEAANFMGRAKGNLECAMKLYKYSEDARTKAEEAAAAAAATAAMPGAAKTPPAPPSPNATEENAAIPSTEDVTTEDVVMEDAPPAAPSDPPPTDSNPPAQINAPDAQPSSQTSNAGIVTSENGTRLVPRSVRMSGTVRSELNIRPGYVPPEDKEVYKVRRDRSVDRRSASKSRSRSGSRSAEEKRGDGPASVSPGGVLTPVTPSERRKDEMEGVEGAQEGQGEGKLNALEWYAERKLKGEEWSHIAVVGWEDAFRLLRVEYKKK